MLTDLRMCSVSGSLPVADVTNTTPRVKAKRMVSVVGWCVALLVLLSVLILFILLVLLLVIAL